ncbi:MAG: hypothetical protein KAS17_09585, partial [Victivallaceae bacterium]|nr:hypothetical protein [Victivallaceae bacterium]
MDLNIQWFIYALADNQIMDLKRCIALYEQLNAPPSLEGYAQEILNVLAETLSSEEAEELLEQFQIAMKFAVGQAQKGVSPSIFMESEAGAVSAGLDQLPDFSRIADLSDQEVADLVIEMLTAAQEMGASDFHISAGSSPFIRHNLKVRKLSDQILTAQDSLRLNTI